MLGKTGCVLIALAATGLVSLIGAAQADTGGLDYELRGSLDVQSDYRFRGISQNNREVAPQGSLNLTGPDGFYLGAWTSKINLQSYGATSNPSLELDLYGGKHFDLGDSTDFNVEAFGYTYLDARVPSGAPGVSYFEGLFQLSHPFGALTLTGTYAITPGFSLNGGTGHYVEGTASYQINDWVSVSGNIGHRWVAGAPTDYSHGDLGVTATYHALSLDLRYFGSDMNSATCRFYLGVGHACGAGPAATLSYNFSLLP